VSLEAASLFSVDGKRAVLTGASGFLGRTMGETLLVNGARLVMLGRSARHDELARAWAASYGSDRVEAHRVDMYDLDELERVLDAIVARGCVDVLVNNAHEMGPATGFNSPDGRLEQASRDQWFRHFTGGIYWAALATQKVGASMVAAGGGSIVNIASMYAAVAPNPALYEDTDFVNPPGYSAVKAGLVAFTRYVAAFWGRQGVRANAILPGPFSNTTGEGPNAVAPGEPFVGRLAARTTLGRVGAPTELAGALLFLASDASSFVTGHPLVVDGGWTIT
jgi:gluconate 5-dehydrogenase